MRRLVDDFRARLDGSDPACPLIFLFGGGFAPTPLTDFATGVSWTDSFNPSAGGDNLTFTSAIPPREAIGSLECPVPS